MEKKKGQKRVFHRVQMHKTDTGFILGNIEQLLQQQNLLLEKLLQKEFKTSVQLSPSSDGIVEQLDRQTALLERIVLKEFTASVKVEQPKVSKKKVIVPAAPVEPEVKTTVKTKRSWFPRIFHRA
jgi:hypothetical protein